MGQSGEFLGQWSGVWARQTLWARANLGWLFGTRKLVVSACGFSFVRAAIRDKVLKKDGKEIVQKKLQYQLRSANALAFSLFFGGL